MSNPLPSHFIVIVPGFLGSKLYDTRSQTMVWPAFESTLSNLLNPHAWLDNLTEVMAYPNDCLQPAGVVEDVIFVPGLIKQEQYSQLLRALEGMGYRASPARYSERDLNVHCFSYDWRQDNRISARQLARAIETWEGFHPGAQAVIIAHSNGGLVARWYVEKEGGKDHSCRLFLMGAPSGGVPKIMDNLVAGVTLLSAPVGIFGIGERIRQAMRTFPSVYQQIPHQSPVLQGPNGEIFYPLTDLSWLGDEQDKFAPLVEDGKRFIEELGTTASVETWCFFGEWQKTPSFGTVCMDPNGHWRQIQWNETDQGDDTVPVVSAILPAAHKKIGVNAGHGHIFMHPAILDRLRNEFLSILPPPPTPSIPDHDDRYANPPDSADTLPVVFTADRDSYQPGEEIQLSANFQVGRADLPPSQPARIDVGLEWIQDLPGTSLVLPPGQFPATVLQANAQDPCVYEGKLIAPQREGYYRIHVAIMAQSGVTADLTQLVAIESAAPN